MADFLFWIGWYNLLGAFLMMAFHSERIADTLMRHWTEVVASAYTHGTFGRLWLWWAAAGNLFLGFVMLRAVGWPPAIQRDVTIGAVGLYGIMYAVLLVGGRKPTYGRGVPMVHLLWIAQISWGGYALWNA
jgi:hypothetical protein